MRKAVRFQPTLNRLRTAHICRAVENQPDVALPLLVKCWGTYVLTFKVFHAASIWNVSKAHWATGRRCFSKIASPVGATVIGVAAGIRLDP